MTNREMNTIKMMERAYIEAYGMNKWESLSNKEKHDVVMALVNITLNTITKLEAGA